jgi:type I restriction enzyme S subunit
MELKPGYMQTEAGVFPDDWTVRTLDALATTVASGKSKVSGAFGNFAVHGSTGVIGYCDSPEYSGDAILVARVGANTGLPFI